MRFLQILQNCTSAQQFAQFGEIEFNYSEIAREEVLFLANWIYYQSKSTYYSIKTVIGEDF